MTTEERKPIYGIGDLIRIVNFGHPLFQNKKAYYEQTAWFKGFEYKAYFGEEKTFEIDETEKPKNLVSEDETSFIIDLRPELVGQDALVIETSMTQGIPSYSLKFKNFGKSSWYHEDQMELINKNPNSI